MPMRIDVELPEIGAVTLDDGVIQADELEPHPVLPRRCYAAGHVVMLESYGSSSHSLEAPGSAAEIAAAIDWDATLALRVRVDEYGMGIAEAMDTAQRFELGWTGAKELLRRTGELNLRNGFVGAASSDHREFIDGVEGLASAIIEQVTFIRECGGVPIVLPQPWMTANEMDEAAYVRLYAQIIDASEGPLLLHWLGEAFHAGMRGYFPGKSIETILAHDPQKVRGLKLSLLDAAYEEDIRTRIGPRGQVILTGDDYNFAGLILGGSQQARPLEPLGGRPLYGGDFSHALLGIFDATVRPASLALQRLARGDGAGYLALMEPCEALGRAIFEAPVQHYKAGIAFLAWLNGFQNNPMLANHEERARDHGHFARVAALASAAGVIENAELAAARLTAFLSGQPAG